jgi:hypothetical protein
LKVDVMMSIEMCIGSSVIDDERSRRVDLKLSPRCLVGEI